MPALRLDRALVALGLVAATGWLAAGCRSCREDETEEQEERDQARDHYWRARIAIVGKGRVTTSLPAFDCASDGATQSGECGPKLMRWKELSPPMMTATPAPGWRLDRWEASIAAPDGLVRPRTGPMPDGRVYLDGFGYADTGELETVRPIFVPVARDGE